MALTYESSVTQQMSGVNCKGLQVCVHVKRRLSEYLILLQIIHVYILMCYIVCQKLQARCFCCVKYTRISLFVSFYISQGSVATYVRRGGKRDMGFIANSWLNLNVKKF